MIWLLEQNLQKNYKMEIKYEPTKRFQWIRGDNFGTVEFLKNEDAVKLYFNSGREIFKTVVDEFMLAVTEDIPIIVEQQQQFVNAPIQNMANPLQYQVTESKKNPISELLDRTKKVKEFDINISITVKIPDVQNYEFLADAYSDDIKMLDEAFLQKLETFVNASTIKEHLKTWFEKNYKNG
jgi:hypothetical protein